MNALERLARALGDDAPLTRRDIAARGLIALGTIGTIGRPQRATAATTACTSLSACLKHAEAAAARAYEACTKEYPDHSSIWDFPTLGCRLWGYRPANEKAEQACRANCPPPKQPRPPKKPPSNRNGTKLAPPPPPLPPNPYDDLAWECANCAGVGGKCCYGRDPKHLRACANPNLPCERYSCTS